MLRGMSKYMLTDNERRDGWYSRDYSYRHQNTAGAPFVQAELVERVASNLPTILWRFDRRGEDPREMERHHIPVGRRR